MIWVFDVHTSTFIQIINPDDQRQELVQKKGGLFVHLWQRFMGERWGNLKLNVFRSEILSYLCWYNPKNKAWGILTGYDQDKEITDKDYANMISVFLQKNIPLPPSSHTDTTTTNATMNNSDAKSRKRNIQQQIGAGANSFSEKKRKNNKKTFDGDETLEVSKQTLNSSFNNASNTPASIHEVYNTDMNNTSQNSAQIHASQNDLFDTIRCLRVG